jgi:hypothetical protein
LTSNTIATASVSLEALGLCLRMLGRDCHGLSWVTEEEGNA